MLPRALLGIVVLAMTFTAPLPLTELAAQDAPRRSTATVERLLQQFGDRVSDSLLRVHGPPKDPGANADVQLIMKRLLSSAGISPTRTAWRVVGSPDVNAITVPGGRIVVFEGLLRFAREAAKQSTDRDRSERDRYLGLVAAVLAHELGHVAYGHADSSVLRAMNQVPAMRELLDADAATQPPARQRAEALLGDRRFLAAMSSSREQESNADHYGALVMLRAGWRIQDAMDFFRRVGDSFENAPTPTGVPRDLASSTWLRSHPRPAVREADLEAFRADLKRDQARYDDAVALIEHGVQLETAVSLLDDVLQRQPHLAAAHHARGGAFFQRWLQGRSTSQLVVPPLVTTLPADIISGIRSADAESQALLDSARVAYARAVAHGERASSLASLAVLDAYAGDRTTARARADSARAIAPNDTAVRINAAAAMLLSGDPGAARQLYVGIASDVPHATFGLGRSLLQLGDTSSAEDALRRFVQADVAGAWAAEAQRLLPRIRGATAARSSSVSGATGNGAPPIGGVRLGQSLTEVLAILGEPDSDRRDPVSRLLTYQSAALQVVLTSESRVKSVITGSPDAGDIDGVRVGAATNAALLRWGAPYQRIDDMLVFARADHWAVVTDADGVIHRLQVAARSP